MSGSLASAPKSSQDSSRNTVRSGPAKTTGALFALGVRLSNMAPGDAIRSVRRSPFRSEVFSW